MTYLLRSRAFGTACQPHSPKGSAFHRGLFLSARIDRFAAVQATSAFHFEERKAMLKNLFLLGAAVGAFSTTAALAQSPEVTLTRLDCGTGFNDSRRFSDTFAYSDPKVPFTFSCYVVKHGDDYMVWDTGYLPGSNPSAAKVTLTDQLAQLKIMPEQVKYVGISHFHADHTGQLPSLPGATLLIGQREWEALTAPKPMQGANVDAFKHWIGGGGKAEPQPADKGGVGAGTGTIPRTPGPT